MYNVLTNQHGPDREEKAEMRPTQTQYRDKIGTKYRPYCRSVESSNVNPTASHQNLCFSLFMNVLASAKFSTFKSETWIQNDPKWSLH